MATSLFRQVGPYRVTTDEGTKAASEAIFRMDPSANSFLFPAIVVLQNKIGWAWRVFAQDDPKLTQNVLSLIEASNQNEPWALLKGPESVTQVIDAEEARLEEERRARERDDRLRREMEIASSRRTRMAWASAGAGAAVGVALIGWRTFKALSRRKRA